MVWTLIKNLLSTFLEVIVKHWRLATIATLAGMLSVSVNNNTDLEVKLALANDTIDRQTVQLEIFETRVNTLNDAIAKQNSAIRELAIQYQEQLDKVEKANAGVIGIATEETNTIIKLNGETVPNDCTGAMGWMIDKAKETE